MTIYVSKVEYENLITYLNENEIDRKKPEEVAWDIVHLILDLKVQKKLEY